MDSLFKITPSLYTLSDLRSSILLCDRCFEKYEISEQEIFVQVILTNENSS